MKTQHGKLIGLITLALVAFMAVPAFAAMDGHAMKGDKKMDHSGHMGMRIHESSVDGYMLAYHMIDNKAQMAKMKDMKGMKMGDMKDMKSHHLMSYIVGSDGKKVEGAKVGYMVTGPDGTVQKAMAMGMKGGYGADVDFSHKGAYTIKTKAKIGDKKVVDSFTYDVK
jgi:hypothetical protein